MRNLTNSVVTEFTEDSAVQMVSLATGELHGKAPIDLFGSVEQYPTFGAFPTEGKENVLYVDQSKKPYTGYTWNGTEYVQLGGQNLDLIVAPIGYVPAATGNTANLNQVVTDPNGDVWAIDYQGDAKLIELAKHLDVLLTVQPTPTATGNTTNLATVFKDARGMTWVIDRNGDAIAIGAQETVYYDVDSTNPPANPLTGDELLVTDTGDASGKILEQWIFDGNSWVQRPLAKELWTNETGTLTNVDQTQPWAAKTDDGAGSIASFSTDVSAGGVATMYGSDKVVLNSGGEYEFVNVPYDADKSTTGILVYNPATYKVEYLNFEDIATPPLKVEGANALKPVVYDGAGYVPAQANDADNVADLIEFPDGKRYHDGKVTWPGHGLTVGVWYYLDPANPGKYIVGKPTTGLVQQLFFAEDANIVHIDIEEAYYAVPPNRIDGTDNDDTLNGTDGFDIIRGLDGNDTLSGDADNDKLIGGAGNDTLDGGAGNDILDGGDGNDSIFAGKGNDTVAAGNGDDYITITGDGNATVDGGAGTDTLDLSNLQDVVVTPTPGVPGSGTATYKGADGQTYTITYSNIETVKVPLVLRDVLTPADQATYDAAAAGTAVPISATSYENIVSQFGASKYGSTDATLNSSLAAGTYPNQTYTTAFENTSFTGTPFATNNYLVAFSIKTAGSPGPTNNGIKIKFSDNLNSGFVTHATIANSPAISGNQRTYYVVKAQTVRTPATAAKIAFYRPTLSTNNQYGDNIGAVGSPYTSTIAAASGDVSSGLVSQSANTTVGGVTYLVSNGVGFQALMTPTKAW